jgi:hypothetical protein
MSAVLRLCRLPLGILLLALCCFASILSGAHAQDSSIPPWPLLFRGTVQMEGIPVAGGQLRVRVGDWESRPVLVADGRFDCAAECLIAGPPSFSYIGQPVTFHLDDAYLGDVSFAFPAGATPQQLDLDLAFSRAVPSPALPTLFATPTSDFPDVVGSDSEGLLASWWPLLLLGGIGLTGLGTGVWEFLRRRQRTKRA